jgi:hypothetical protein
VGSWRAPNLVDFDFVVKVSSEAVETSTRPFFDDLAKAWNKGGAS